MKWQDVHLLIAEDSKNPFRNVQQLCAFSFRSNNFYPTSELLEKVRLTEL